MKNMEYNSYLLDLPEQDPRKGTAALRLGVVIATDAEDVDKPVSVLWAEYDQPKYQIDALRRLLQLDPSLDEKTLRDCHPYHFKDIYIRKENPALLEKNYIFLDRASRCWTPLNFEDAWEEDIASFQKAAEDLDDAQEEEVLSMSRPRWTQVQAEESLRQAQDNYASEQTRFITYWKDKVPFVKDEVFEELVKDGKIRHPETLKY